MILHLGVIDVPYDNREPGGQKKAGKTPNETTGDVAEILENKYHVMEIFFELMQHRIAADLEESMAGALENLLIGAPVSTAQFGDAENAIKQKFSKFLENKVMDTLNYPGVPTKAALNGVSHRFKHPYAKRPSRPSFVDTGAYENSFRAWIE